MLEMGECSMTENRDDFSRESSMELRYQRAQVLAHGAMEIRKVALNTNVTPYWIDDSSFWYRKETTTGYCYRVVDVDKNQHIAAFDHEGLSDALHIASGEKVDPEKLPLLELEFEPSSEKVRFRAFGAYWEFDSATKRCSKLDSGSGSGKVSPNGKQVAFVRDHNLWVSDTSTGHERALTTDGNEFYVYSSAPTALGNIMPSVLDIMWSPDSNYIITQLTDTKDVNRGQPLVQYAPPCGSLHSAIVRPDRRVASFGDANVESWKFLAIHVNTGVTHALPHDPCPLSYPHYKGYFGTKRGWWSADSRQAFLIFQNSDCKNTRVLKWDIESGTVDVVVKEDEESCSTIIPALHLSALATPLPETNELIWYSERSGWAHLYLYDLASGLLKKTITSGDWCVRNILHYDARQRELIIQTSGRVEGRNPYYQDICRVNIDTGELLPVISTDHEYTVADNKCFYFGFDTKTAGVSPDGKYIVVTRSRVDDIPLSFLFNRDGQQLFVVETADVSSLPKHWQWPEPVMVKSEDNNTDIYGVIFRPSDFSPDRSYPVLDLSFAFSEPIGSFNNNAQGSYHYLMSMAFAELGFIVVRFNNRGEGLRHGAGLREKAFSEFKDTALPFHNKADCVAGIRQLCEMHTYMDINRVGVVDYATIPSALTGMLIYPQFYKVGVSLNSLTNGRIYPMNVAGGDVFPSYEDFVGNLCGKLLLMHGMLDDAVPVAGFFRMVEAFKNANKNFDMLLLPNLGHGSYDGYTLKRCWDYLVMYLLDEKPPEKLVITLK